MEINLILSALAIGFAGGFHCVGMCGPIAISLGMSRQHALKFHVQNTVYNLGRITTYGLLGLLVGIIGKGFQLAGLQQFLSVVSGVLLILMAILYYKAPNFNPTGSLFSNIFSKLKQYLGTMMGKKDVFSRYITGVLNGFLPCGLVYMALTASLAAGGVVQSSLFMVAFGFGTFPFMFGMVLAGHLITQQLRNKMLKIIPVMLVVLGSLFILRGLDLGIPYISPTGDSLHINTSNGSHHSCH